MDVFYVYTYGTAGWLSLQALPLLLTPNLVVTLLSSEARKSSGRLLKSCYECTETTRLIDCRSRGLLCPLFSFRSPSPCPPYRAPHRLDTAHIQRY